MHYQIDDNCHTYKQSAKPVYLAMYLLRLLKAVGITIKVRKQVASKKLAITRCE